MCNGLKLKWVYNYISSYFL